MKTTELTMENAAEIMGLKITASPKVANVKPVCSDLSEPELPTHPTTGLTFFEIDEQNAELTAINAEIVVALENIIRNAVIQPDASMKGATDCYAVTLDDIENAREVLAKAKGGKC